MSNNDETDEQKMRRLSRRGFIWAGISVLGTYGGFKWLSSQSKDMGIPWPLRRSLEMTDDISVALLQHNTPEFKDRPVDSPVRVNGKHGHTIASRDGFKLVVQGISDQDVLVPLDQDVLVPFEDILKMPRMEMVTELKCIEGWVQTVRWAGVPLTAFIAKYPPLDASGNPIDPVTDRDKLPEYIALETMDKGYYVGLDMASALHPQTMLCYEMNGEPLTSDHGAPLRLVIPVKYGVKNIKWLATLRYSRKKTPDYWTERGYDWFAGV